jgi:hypothetical protein
VTLNQANLNERLAFCSWSLQPTSVDDVIDGARQIGLTRVQLALEPLVGPSEGWADAIARLRNAGISIVSGMMSCVGEDYTTMESIHRTGGVVPDVTWPRRGRTSVRSPRSPRKMASAWSRCMPDSFPTTKTAFCMRSW